MPRKSECLASKPRKRYNEQEDETEMAALMGASDDDDDEGEEGEGGQGTYHG